MCSAGAQFVNHWKRTKDVGGTSRLEFPRILNIHYILDPGKTFLGADITS
jgi:hypothetical protein